MARLRFPGRPGKRFGRSNVKFGLDDFENLRDQSLDYVGSIERALKRFRDVYGDSDEDEDFEGFDPSELEVRSPPRRSERERVPSSRLSEFALDRQTLSSWMSQPGDEDEDEDVSDEDTPDRSPPTERRLSRNRSEESVRYKEAEAPRSKDSHTSIKGRVTKPKLQTIKIRIGADGKAIKVVRGRGRPPRTVDPPKVRRSLEKDVPKAMKKAIESKSARKVGRPQAVPIPRGKKEAKAKDITRKVELKRTERKPGRPQKHVRVLPMSKKVDKNVAKQLLQKAKMGNMRRNLRAGGSPPTPQSKAPGKFQLPPVSSRSSRIIKPRKRFIEDDDFYFPMKVPRLDLTMALAKDSPQTEEDMETRTAGRASKLKAQSIWKKSLCPSQHITSADMTQQSRTSILKPARLKLPHLTNQAGGVEATKSDDLGLEPEDEEKLEKLKLSRKPKENRADQSKKDRRNRKAGSPGDPDATPSGSVVLPLKGAVLGRKNSSILRRAKLKLSKAMKIQTKKEQLNKLQTQWQRDSKEVQSPIQLRSFPLVQLNAIPGDASPTLGAQPAHKTDGEPQKVGKPSPPQQDATKVEGDSSSESSSSSDDDDEQSTESAESESLSSSVDSSRGPRIKHVCRRAAVALGKSLAVFPTDDKIRLSALPPKEKRRLLHKQKAEERSGTPDSDEVPNRVRTEEKPKRPLGLGSPPKSRRRRRCGTCAGCQRTEDCGKCPNCKDKTKFGGFNVKKQCCIHKKCRNPQPAGNEGVRPRNLVAVRRAKVPSRNSTPPVDGAANNRTKGLSVKRGNGKDNGNSKDKTAGPSTSGVHRPRPIRAGDNGKQLLKVDFKEEYDVENAWEGGMVILASTPLITRIVCYLCASAGQHEFLYCAVCCEAFHQFCLEEEERPLDGREQDWCCRRCRFCTVCGRQNGVIAEGRRALTGALSLSLPQLLQCHKCHDMYHGECLSPNYPTRPTKKKKIWICPKCVRCKSCGRTTPGQAYNAQWTHEFSLCQDCGKLFDMGNYCPICKKCYSDDDYESKMMQCGKCESWVHAKCELLTDELYEVLSCIPDTVHYTCPSCTQTEPPEWRQAVQKELYTGFQQVLGTLLSHKSGEHLLYTAQEQTADTEVTPAVTQEVQTAAEPAMEVVTAEARDKDTKTEEELPAEGVEKKVETPEKKTDDPKDLVAVRKQVEAMEYTSVSVFCTNLVRIIQGALSAAPDNSILKTNTNIIRVLFIKQMERYFPWFDVQGCRLWEHNKNLPKGMLPNAVLPPSMEHDYAQWRVRPVGLDPTPQPSPLKVLTPRKHTSRQGGTCDLSGNTSVIPMEVGDPDDTRQCCLCARQGECKPNDAGRMLYAGQDDWVHANCALWSAEVYEEADGSLQNVHTAISRGRQMRCEQCSKLGATVGCCTRGCPANFHFMCARLEECLFQEDKKVFCKEHKDKVDGELVKEDSFEVNRRVCVNMDNIKLNRKWMRGLEPTIIQVLTGSMTVESLGELNDLSDTKDALLPVGFVCTRVYWSTYDARRRCIYTCRITEFRPEKPKPAIELNRTTAHEEPVSRDCSSQPLSPRKAHIISPSKLGKAHRNLSTEIEAASSSTIGEKTFHSPKSKVRRTSDGTYVLSVQDIEHGQAKLSSARTPKSLLDTTGSAISMKLAIRSTERKTERTRQKSGQHVLPESIHPEVSEDRSVQSDSSSDATSAVHSTPNANTTMSVVRTTQTTVVTTAQSVIVTTQSKVITTQSVKSYETVSQEGIVGVTLPNIGVFSPPPTNVLHPHGGGHVQRTLQPQVATPTPQPPLLPPLGCVRQPLLPSVNLAQRPSLKDTTPLLPCSQTSEVFQPHIPQQSKAIISSLIPEGQISSSGNACHTTSTQAPISVPNIPADTGSSSLMAKDERPLLPVLPTAGSLQLEVSRSITNTSSSNSIDSGRPGATLSSIILPSRSMVMAGVSLTSSGSSSQQGGCEGSDRIKRARESQDNENVACSSSQQNTTVSKGGSSHKESSSRSPDETSSVQKLPAASTSAGILPTSVPSHKQVGLTSVSSSGSSHMTVTVTLPTGVLPSLSQSLSLNKTTPTANNSTSVSNTLSAAVSSSPSSSTPSPSTTPTTADANHSGTPDAMLTRGNPVFYGSGLVKSAKLLRKLHNSPGRKAATASPPLSASPKLSQSSVVTKTGDSSATAMNAVNDKSALSTTEPSDPTSDVPTSNNRSCATPMRGVKALPTKSGNTGASSEPTFLQAFIDFSSKDHLTPNHVKPCVVQIADIRKQGLQKDTALYRGSQQPAGNKRVPNGDIGPQHGLIKGDSSDQIIDSSKPCCPKCKKQFVKKNQLQKHCRRCVDEMPESDDEYVPEKEVGALSDGPSDTDGDGKVRGRERYPRRSSRNRPVQYYDLETYGTSEDERSEGKLSGNESHSPRYRTRMSSGSGSDNVTSPTRSDPNRRGPGRPKKRHLTPPSLSSSWQAPEEGTPSVVSPSRPKFKEETLPSKRYSLRHPKAYSESEGNGGEVDTAALNHQERSSSQGTSDDVEREKKESEGVSSKASPGNASKEVGSAKLEDNQGITDVPKVGNGTERKGKSEERKVTGGSKKGEVGQKTSAEGKSELDDVLPTDIVDFVLQNSSPHPGEHGNGLPPFPADESGTMSDSGKKKELESDMTDRKGPDGDATTVVSAVTGKSVDGNTDCLKPLRTEKEKSHTPPALASGELTVNKTANSLKTPDVDTRGGQQNRVSTQTATSVNTKVVVQLPQPTISGPTPPLPPVTTSQISLHALLKQPARYSVAILGSRKQSSSQTEKSPSKSPRLLPKPATTTTAALVSAATPVPAGPTVPSLPAAAPSPATIQTVLVTAPNPSAALQVPTVANQPAGCFFVNQQGMPVYLVPTPALTTQLQPQQLSIPVQAPRLQQMALSTGLGPGTQPYSLTAQAQPIGTVNHVSQQPLQQLLSPQRSLVSGELGKVSPSILSTGHVSPSTSLVSGSVTVQVPLLPASAQGQATIISSPRVKDLLEKQRIVLGSPQKPNSSPAPQQAANPTVTDNMTRRRMESNSIGSQTQFVRNAMSMGTKPNLNTSQGMGIMTLQNQTMMTVNNTGNLNKSPPNAQTVMWTPHMFSSLLQSANKPVGSPLVSPIQMPTSNPISLQSPVNSVPTNIVSPPQPSILSTGGVSNSVMNSSGSQGTAAMGDIISANAALLSLAQLQHAQTQPMVNANAQKTTLLQNNLPQVNLASPLKHPLLPENFYNSLESALMSSFNSQDRLQTGMSFPPFGTPGTVANTLQPIPGSSSKASPLAQGVTDSSVPTGKQTKKKSSPKRKRPAAPSTASRKKLRPEVAEEWIDDRSPQEGANSSAGQGSSSPSEGVADGEAGRTGSPLVSSSPSLSPTPNRRGPRVKLPTRSSPVHAIHKGTACIHFTNLSDLAQKYRYQDLKSRIPTSAEILILTCDASKKYLIGVERRHLPFCNEFQGKVGKEQPQFSFHCPGCCEYIGQTLREAFMHFLGPDSVKAQKVRTARSRAIQFIITCDGNKWEKRRLEWKGPPQPSLGLGSVDGGLSGQLADKGSFEEEGDAHMLQHYRSSSNLPTGRSSPWDRIPPHPSLPMPEDEADSYSPLLKLHEIEEEQRRQQAQTTTMPKEDKPKLVFEITSDDGFKTTADTIDAAWDQVVEKVQEARINARMKQLSFAAVNGCVMLGVTHESVMNLMEQLAGAKNCIHYKFKYHKYSPHDLAEDEDPPVNPNGCCRAEVLSRRSKFDMFSWLASQHRQLPVLDYNEEEEEVQHKSTRRPTSMDLPMAMRFRYLRQTSREAVGVYRSPIHGRGLFCKRNIDSGEMVIEYAGMVIRSVLTDKRENYYNSKGIGCYMFRIDDYEVVDATMHGNAARFINHSCEPNCYSRVIQVEGKKHIVIFAMRKIYKGEELTYDYKFPIEDQNSKIDCTCGSKRCRKYLN
ncbi:histone-lysine N-methyltransferase 2A-like isoform X1 [Branchiostoma lanceolatum]|uniref:histone-lysine N-methyltransferase 2A-like isoform X1 n=1 Tax=Branchiostoma lanceolatum TaxID=7740 RepID=UPI003455CF49